MFSVKKHVFKTLVFLVLLLSSCGYDKKSKKDYRRTFLICDNLYVERYNVFGSGAYGGDMVSDFLTDSVNFRIYTGTFDNASDVIHYECNSDSIFIEQSSNYDDNGSKVVGFKAYSLNELKAKKKFE